MKNQFELLAKRRFLPLFITQFLGAFNDNVFKNALTILITYNLANIIKIPSSEMVAIATAIFILPYFLFSALAGQLADKYERSKLIRYTKIIEIILSIFAILGFYFQSINWLMTVLFLLGTQATFFGPLKYAILPDHLHRNEILAGNGLVEGGTFIAILIGTILSGILVVQSAGEPLISAVMLTVAVTGWLASRYIPLAPPHNPQLKINPNFLLETKRLVNYTRQFPGLFLAIIGISWFWLVGAIFLSEMPPFVKNILHGHEYIVTLFFTLFSIGIAIGSLICNWLTKGRVDMKLVLISALLMSAFILDLCWGGWRFAAPANTVVYLQGFLSSWSGFHLSLDILGIAIAGGIYIVPLYTLLQTDSDPAFRAQVIASNNIVNAFFMVLSAVFSVSLLRFGFSITQLFLIVGILNIFVGFYITRKK